MKTKAVIEAFNILNQARTWNPELTRITFCDIDTREKICGMKVSGAEVGKLDSSFKRAG